MLCSTNAIKQLGMVRAYVKKHIQFGLHCRAHSVYSQGRIQEFRKGGGGGGGGTGRGWVREGDVPLSVAKRGSFEQYSNTDTHS